VAAGFSTSDPEIAVLEVTKLLAPHHLVIDDVARFHVPRQERRS